MLVAVLMATASLLSALINTITVAVILPCNDGPGAAQRQTPLPPSFAMALGCLLGGPFTGISTPPNILVTEPSKRRTGSLWDI